MKDTYGSAYREAMYRSMSRPALHPTFVAMSPNTRPVGTSTDRRSSGLLRKARRVYWHWSDSLGLFLWLIAGLLVSVMAWMCFIGVESWFR